MTRTRFVTGFVVLLIGSAVADAQTIPSNEDICRADVSKNGIVDTADVDIVNAAYRTVAGQPKFNAAVDFNGDGAITIWDRTFVTAKVGLSCTTSGTNRPPVFTSAPIVTANFGAAYSYLANATDPDGDALTFALQLGPAGMVLTPPRTIAWVAGAVGPHHVRIGVSDGKGGSATQDFVVTVAAPATPNVVIAAPTTGLVTRTASQTVNGTVSDLAVTSATVRLNGSDKAVVVAKGAFTLPVTLAEGLNRIVASASNAGGTGTSAEVMVTLDSVGPSLSAVMPPTVAAGARVELLAEASDSSGVASVTLRVNGQPGGSMTRLPYVFAVDVPPSVAQGAVLPLQFTATDNLGNTRTVDRALTVDTPADTRSPSVLLSIPATAAPGEIIPVLASAQDDRAVTQLSIVRGANTLRQVAEAPFAVQHPFAVPANATPGQVIELGARAKDAAGNEGTAAASFTVVSSTNEQSSLHLAVNGVVSPTFLPSQVITGKVSTQDVQGQATRRAFVASLSITNGRQGERLQIGIIGANSSFAGGLSQASFGAGIVVNEVTVQSPTQLTADITIAADAGIGPRLVAVQTGPEEALLINAFNVRSGVGTIAGKLLDTTGQPLAGVEVCVPGSTLCVLTGDDGTFTLVNAPSTATRLSVNVPGLNLVSVPLQLAVGGNTTLGDIPIDISDIAPPPPPPGGPQPPPAVAKLLGLGFGDTGGGLSLAKGRRLITEAILAVGGSEAGVLDETGRQLNPEVAGHGLITLTPDGVRMLANRLERGETTSLGDLLFAWSFGFRWSGPAPTLAEWIEVMQARVNQAWANPSDPPSFLPILVFNRDRVLPKQPPMLSPETRLGAMQSFLLTASFLGAMMPESLVGARPATAAAPMLLAAAGLNAWPSTINELVLAGGARRPRSPAVSDSLEVYARLFTTSTQAQNNRRFTGFWRNAFQSKNTFPTTVLNNAFQTHLLLQFALALPAMAPAGLVGTLGGIGVASAFMGTVADTLRTSFQAIKDARLVPEPPEFYCARVSGSCEDSRVEKAGDDSVLVHFDFRPSRSHVKPGESSTSGVGYAYSLYRFRTSDSERKLVDYVVITKDSQVRTRSITGDGLRLVGPLDENEFFNNVVLTLTDREPLPLVEDSNGDQVRAITATWFYTLTVTRFGDAEDAVRPDILESAGPWWNYPLQGRLDPGGLAALHNRTKKAFTSDYSAPKVTTVNASGIASRVDGLEVDANTGLAYYSDTVRRNIYQVDLSGGGSTTLFAVTGFKNEQAGLAIDSLGSLYTDNVASNAEFGGRIFKFTQPAATREHVGNMNYYSFLLQFAHPTSVGAMAIAPGSQPNVSAEDLFAIDDLAQSIKRVPVRATFDATRRIGQPWATLPFQARAVDLEFQPPTAEAPQGGDGYLLMTDLPSASLVVQLQLARAVVALGDPLRLTVTVTNPGSLSVQGVQPVLEFSGAGRFLQVSAPPAPVVLAGGGSATFEVELNAADGGPVTIRAQGRGTDQSGVTISSPFTARHVEILPPLEFKVIAPERAAPGELFTVRIAAHNLSTTTRLTNVVPTLTPVETVLQPGDVKGEVTQQSGPTPPTFTLDPNATLEFVYKLRGSKPGRVGLNAQGTAINSNTQDSMTSPIATARIHITPFEISLELEKRSVKLQGLINAKLIVKNTSALALTSVTPTITPSGLGQVQFLPPFTPISMTAGQEHAFQFQIKGLRTGFVNLEALVTAVVDGATVRSDVDTEPFGVGPTISGVISDVGFRAFNLAYTGNTMVSNIADLNGLAGIRVVARDDEGNETEATSAADGKYVLSVEHGGPFTITAVDTASHVGARLRDRRVTGDSLELPIRLPVTLVDQARRTSLALHSVGLQVSHDSVEVGTTASNLFIDYSQLAPAFTTYLQRFQRDADTPVYEGPYQGTGREPNDWDALTRMTLLLAFQKRRFDEAAKLSALFVKDVVEFAVSKIGVSKLSDKVDEAVQTRLLGMPDSKLLEKEAKQMKADFAKAVAKSGLIGKALTMINSVACKIFGQSLEAAYALGAIELSDKKKEDLMGSCATVTATAKVVIEKMVALFALKLSSFGPGQLVDALNNELKKEGMIVGMRTVMNLYVQTVTEPLLLSELRKIESPLSLQGETSVVLFSLRQLDDQTRTEVLQLLADIAGAGEADSGLLGFLKSAASVTERQLFKVLSQGGGVVGKVIAFMTNINRMKAFAEVTVMGPGKVCRAANQILRAETDFVNEPPAATMFCVEDLPEQ